MCPARCMRQPLVAPPAPACGPCSFCSADGQPFGVAAAELQLCPRPPRGRQRCNHCGTAAAGHLLITCTRPRMPGCAGAAAGYTANGDDSGDEDSAHGSRPQSPWVPDVNASASTSTYFGDRPRPTSPVRGRSLAFLLDRPLSPTDV